MKIPLIKRPEAGLTLFDILTLIGMVFILLFLYGNYMDRQRRLGYARMNCSSSLKQDALAMRLFSGDNNDKFPAQALLTNNGDYERLGNDLPRFLFTAMSNELSATKILTCRADNRLAATNFNTLQTSNISYFITLDASDSNTSAIILGDRDLQLQGVEVKPGIFPLYTNSAMTWAKTIHKVGGNVALSDGSVQQAISSSLQGFISKQDLPTNRLAFP
jgi:hypothetical protein